MTESDTQPQPEEQKAERAALPPAKEVSRGKNSPTLAARLLRWLLGFLVLVGLGALLAIYTLYLPAQEKLNQANLQISTLSGQATSELIAANQEIDRLASLDTENKDLQSELDQATLYNTVLRARLDVTSALLSLANQETEKARLSLNKTSGVLKELESLLPQDQRKVVADLQKRLELVLDELDKNVYAARSDLDVLANGLLELESAILR
ncbi:MAG: hypothetical protein JXB15_00115 [Anaerolineales bacterium]|nr:hypothetical protein [Anaerolineales bacterium]